jgi:hypothetical protein
MVKTNKDNCNSQSRNTESLKEQQESQSPRK